MFKSIVQARNGYVQPPDRIRPISKNKWHNFTFQFGKNIQKISKNKVLLKMYLIVILISFIAEISA